MPSIDFMNGRRAVIWTAVKDSVGAVAQSSNTMMWICEADGYCIFLNHQWYQFTGQEPGKGEGYGWLNVVHPDDRAGASKAFANAVALVEPYQVDYRLKRRGDHLSGCQPVVIRFSMIWAKSLDIWDLTSAARQY